MLMGGRSCTGRLLEPIDAPSSAGAVTVKARVSSEICPLPSGDFLKDYENKELINNSNNLM